MPRLERSADHEKLYRLTPAGAMRLLGADAYWRFDFLQLFLDRIDVVRMDDPEKAQAFALVAPELVRRIPLGTKRRGFPDAREREIWWTYALGVQASALRATGRTEEAAMVFEMAFRTMGEIEGPPAWLRGQLLLRRSIFRGYQGVDGYFDELQEAIEICREAHDSHPLAQQGHADSLLARGNFGWVRADPGVLEDFALAMKVVDRKTPRGKMSFDCGFYNLLFVSAEGEECLRKQALVLQTLVELRRSMARSSRRRRVFVRWSEGRLLTNLGLYCQATKALEYAHRHLSSTISEPVELLLMLDLVLVYALTEKASSYRDLVEGRCWRGISEPELRGIVLPAFSSSDLPSEATARRVRLAARDWVAGRHNLY